MTKIPFGVQSMKVYSTSSKRKWRPLKYNIDSVQIGFMILAVNTSKNMTEIHSKERSVFSTKKLSDNVAK